MNGNSILTLGTASNTFSGGTTVSAGTLTITAGGSNTASALGVGQSVAISSGGELRLAAGDALGYYGANPTSFTINGGIMSIAAGIHDSVLNSGVTLSAGTITSEGAGDSTGNYIFDGNVATLASSTASVISPQTLYLRGYGSGGTITFNVAHGTAVPDLLVSAAMTQSIPIVKTGAGLMVVTGPNSYSTTTISNGTLQVGNGGASGTLGSGNITDNATLVFSRSDSGLTVAGVIGGSGNLFQNGSGMTTLSAAPTLTGTTTVSGGTLNVTATGNWTVPGPIVINGGVYSLNGGANQVNMGTTTSPVGITFGASGGTFASNNTNFYPTSATAGTMTIATVGGAQAFFTATATGGLNTDNDTTVFNLVRGTGAADLTMSGPLWNGGAVVETGNGILEITSSNSTSTFTAPMTISGGTLLVDGAGVLNNGSYAQTISNSGTLIFNSSSNQTLSGAISGSGTFYQNGGGVTILSATNTYTGPTVVNKGILELNNAGNGSNDGIYASSLVTVNSGGQVLVNQTNALQGWGSTAGSLAINAGGLVTISNGITCHIRGPLVLNGGTLASGTPNATYGSWVLDYPVTANGATTSTMSAGQMSWTGTQTFTVSNSAGTLYVPGTFAYPSAFTGGLTMVGPGTMILAGNNTYTGATTISSGTLQVGGGGVLGGGSYSAAISNSGALVMSTSTNQTLSGVISGPGSLYQLGSGTTTLSANNTFTGTTTVSGGMLLLNNGGTGGALTNSAITVGSGGELDLPASDALGWQVTNSLTVSGIVKKTADESETITRPVTLSGGTMTSTGTFNNGSGAWDWYGNGNAATITTASGTTNFINGTGGFSLRGASNYFNLGANSTLIISVPVIQNGNSSNTPLNLQGAGTLVLTAANTYTGATNISNGTLQVGNGGASGTLGTGNITDNATLIFSRSDTALNVANAISGSGAIVQLGSGMTQLSGSSSFNGTVAVNAGTLKITGSLASTSVTVANGACLDRQRQRQHARA